MNEELITALCPVCSHTLAAPLFDGGQQPLATLGWPASAAAAKAMPRLPLDFVQCCNCSHVWNRAFRYEAIPYQSNPNRMFNTGGIWGGHLAGMRDALLAQLGDAPCVVEIGCGEAHFLRALAQQRPGGRYVGFDPHGHAANGEGIEFHARLFEPLDDVAAFKPDAIVIRHVLEHLTEPAALLEALAYAVSANDKPCLMFAEVPCIDRVFETLRSADFFYEHVGQFTTRSFDALMRRSGEIASLAHGYDGEVVYAFVQLGSPATRRQQARIATSFSSSVQQARQRIRSQLNDLAASPAKVAIWGGTGKAAAFMHYFEADAERFPLVVDSDRDKVGTFVPGTGQQIRFRDELKSSPVDVVIIPTQWRAADIIAEMARENIQAPRVLIEHGGQLIDFHLDANPYRR